MQHPLFRRPEPVVRCPKVNQPAIKFYIVFTGIRVCWGKFALL